MAVIAPSSLLHGGRALYTVNERENGKMFAIKVGSGVPDIYRSVILSYRKKTDAIALALALECHKSAAGAFPNPKFDLGDTFDLRDTIYAPTNLMSIATENVRLSDTSVEKWDEYYLRQYILSRNMAIMICDDNLTNALMFRGRYIEPSFDAMEYIDKFNEMYYQ